MTVKTTTMILLGASLAAAAAAADDAAVDPYTAYVVADDAYARCGPSHDYYRTDALRPGAEVEVYLETSTGWLGIRPPDSSFSWIPAARVEMNADGVTGKVRRNNTSAWVGTNLGKARHYRWQVQLAAGENVTVLDEKSRRRDSDADSLWYRIVPPPGEFRWVHRDDVTLSRSEYERRRAEARMAERRKSRRGDESEQSDARETELAADQADPAAKDPPPAPPPTASVAAESKANAADTPAVPSPAGGVTPLQPVGSGVAQAAGWETEDAEPADAAPAADAGFTAVDEVHVAPVDRLATAAFDAADARQATAATASIDATEKPLERFQDGGRAADADISGLQVLLAEALAARATARDVEPIRRRAQWWIDHEEEAVQRGRARLLVERVERYQHVARRRDGQPAPASEDAAVPVVDEQTGLTSVYDRSGYLVQVYSARPDAPPYALNDREGRTVAYVSPAPGLNLRRYLNQEVGMYGRTGYLTGLDTPHLVAERIVRLQR